MSITRKKKQNGLFYTKAEERINTLSHAAGILMGIIVGTIFLVKGYQSGNFWAVFGIWLYLFCMLGSYVSSTLYHCLLYTSTEGTSCVIAGSGNLGGFGNGGSIGTSSRNYGRSRGSRNASSSELEDLINDILTIEK